METIMVTIIVVVTMLVTTQTVTTQRNHPQVMVTLLVTMRVFLLCDVSPETTDVRAETRLALRPLA